MNLRVPSLLFSLLLLTSQLSAQSVVERLLPEPAGPASALRTQFHYDLPQLAWEFDWNDSAQDWDSVGRHTWAYDVNGRNIYNLRELWNGAGWDPDRRVNTSHTQQNGGWVHTDTIEEWNGSSWDPDTRWTTHFDSLGDHVLWHVESYNTGVWDTVGGGMNTYAYQNGILVDRISRQFDGNGVYTPFWRESRTIDGNNEVDTLTQWDWDLVGQQWIPTFRMVDISWYNQTRELADSALIQVYNAGWLDYQKGTCTFGANFSSDCIMELWNGSSWDLEERLVEDRDVEDHTTNYESMEYVNGNWSMVWGYRNSFIYGPNGETYERTSQDWINGNWINDDRWVYQNFFVGVNEVVEELPGLTIYPNPASTVLSFEFEAQPGKSVSVELYDLQGRRRLVQHTPRWQGGVVQVELPAVLPDGVYLYRLQVGDQASQGKVMVRK